MLWDPILKEKKKVRCICLIIALKTTHFLFTSYQHTCFDHAIFKNNQNKILDIILGTNLSLQFLGNLPATPCKKHNSIFAQTFVSPVYKSVTSPKVTFSGAHGINLSLRIIIQYALILFNSFTKDIKWKTLTTHNEITLHHNHFYFILFIHWYFLPTLQLSIEKDTLIVIK